MSDTIFIETDRLNLRVLDMQDKAAFFGYRSLPEVCKYQSWRPNIMEDIEAFISENLAVVPNTPDTWLQLAICLKDGKLIGDIGVHFTHDDFHAEIGYTLSPAYQGHGYAREAVKAVIGFLFSELKKHRVTASVDPDNSRSVRLLEQLGLRKEAHLIKSYFMDGSWYDDCIYAVLDEAWA